MEVDTNFSEEYLEIASRQLLPGNIVQSAQEFYRCSAGLPIRIEVT